MAIIETNGTGYARIKDAFDPYQNVYLYQTGKVEVAFISDSKMLYTSSPKYEERWEFFAWLDAMSRVIFSLPLTDLVTALNVFQADNASQLNGRTCLVLLDKGVWQYGGPHM